MNEIIDDEIYLQSKKIDQIYELIFKILDKYNLSKDDFEIIERQLSQLQNCNEIIGIGKKTISIQKSCRGE